MRQSFLDSLKGMSASKAREAAQKAGHLVTEIPDGMAAAAVAYPNTVILWLDECENVARATAGDPLEVK